MKKQFLRFILLSLLGALPAIALVAYFFVANPMGNFGMTPKRLDSNLAHTSVCTFLNNEPAHHFDSFLIGNSMSLYIKMDEWMKYLPSDARPTHICSAGATIPDVLEEVKFITKNAPDFKRCLIVITSDYLDDPLCTDGQHNVIIPQFKDDISTVWKFHHMYFSAFRQQENLKKIFGPAMPEEMCLRILPNDTVTHQTDTKPLEDYISQDEQSYFNRIFSTHHQSSLAREFCMRKPISQKHLQILRQIAQILNDANIDYYFITPPAYTTLGMPAYTRQALYDIFGERFQDFSDRHDISDDWNNYYDTNHLNSYIWKQILKECYDKDIPQHNFFTSATNSSSVSVQGNQ